MFVKGRAASTMYWSQHTATLFPDTKAVAFSSVGFTPSVKWPTLRQPIPAHYKQSSCRITPWHLRKHNTFTGFEPQTHKGRMKSHRCAPCYFDRRVLPLTSCGAGTDWHTVPRAMPAHLNHMDKFLTGWSLNCLCHFNEHTGIFLHQWHSAKEGQ